MKTKKITLMIVVLMYSFILFSQNSLSTFETRVGSLVFKPTNKTKIVRDRDSISIYINSGIKDMVLRDKVVYIRYHVLDDRIIRIENDGGMKFHFISSYRDNQKIDPTKLVECLIDTTGKVVEIKTTYKIDPQGKNVWVVKKKLAKYMRSAGITDEDLILDNDPLVVRYQKEVNVLLKLF